MSRRPVLALVLAAVVLLPGCSLFEAPAGSPTPTVTDTPTETPTPTAVPGGESELAPGVTEAGVVNASRLFAAHDAALRRSGYVLRENASLAAPNGTVTQSRTTRIAAAPQGEQILYWSTGYGPFATPRTETTVWVADGNATTRFAVDGTVTYTIRPRERFDRNLTAGATLGGIVRGAPFEVADVTTRDGTRVVTLTADFSPFGDGSDRTTARLVVDGAGRIHELDYTHRFPGDVGTHHVEYRLVSLGGDGPAPPSWLADVPPNADLDVRLSVSTGPDSVAITHGGGSTVPAGTFVEVSGNGSRYAVQLEERLWPNETVYVYLTAEDVLVTSRAPPDEGIRPLPQPHTIRVVTADGVVLFRERFALPGTETSG